MGVGLHPATYPDRRGHTSATQEMVFPHPLPQEQQVDFITSLHAADGCGALARFRRTARAARGRAARDWG